MLPQSDYIKPDSYNIKLRKKIPRIPKPAKQLKQLLSILRHERYWGFLFVPFINLINYYLTYSKVNFDSYFLVTYGVDTLEGLVAWYTGRFIIKRLDIYLPYEQGILKRVLAQTLLTTITIIAVITLLTIATHLLFGKGPFPRSFFTFDLLIFFIWCLVFNAIYICYYFFTFYQEGKSKMQALVPTTTSDFLISRIGKQKVSVPFNQILCIYISDEVVLVLDKELKTSYIDKSIQELEQLLQGWLFRANRQFLISKDIIKAFAPLEHGKIGVTLQTAVNNQSQIIISRTKSADFRKWIN